MGVAPSANRSIPGCTIVIVRCLGVLVVVAGCGRLGFDATSSRANDAASDPAGDTRGDAALLHTEITAGNADALDLFGNALAVSRDGSTLVAGAPQEDSGATGVNGDETDNATTDSGATYVLTRTPGGWMQQAYLKPHIAKANQNFGVSVAVSADGSTLAVGELFCDDGATDAGCVELFARSGTTWTFLQTVAAKSPDTSDEFGYSVALSDDGNTLVTGAPNESSAATTIDGNAADNSASDAGAAYVFVRTGNTYTQQAYLKAPNGETLDVLGSSVACSADGNTVAVGAPQESSADPMNPGDNSRPKTGAVYVYTRAGVTWTFRDYVKAPTITFGDFFGLSVGLSADGTRLIVGAPGSDVAASNAGAADVYLLGSIATVEATLAAAIPGDTDQLGVNVAISGDGATVIAGAALEDSGTTDPNDNSAPDAGAAYRYVRSGSSWTQVEYMKRATPTAGDNFGFPVAVSRDASVIAVGAGASFASAGSVTVTYFGQ